MIWPSIIHKDCYTITNQLTSVSENETHRWLLIDFVANKDTGSSSVLYEADFKFILNRWTYFLDLFEPKTQ